MAKINAEQIACVCSIVEEQGDDLAYAIGARACLGRKASDQVPF